MIIGSMNDVVTFSRTTIDNETQVTIQYKKETKCYRGFSTWWHEYPSGKHDTRVDMLLVRLNKLMDWGIYENAGNESRKD